MSDDALSSDVLDDVAHSYAEDHPVDFTPTGDGQEHTYGNSTGDLLAEHIANTNPGDDPVATAVETVVSDAVHTFVEHVTDDTDHVTDDTDGDPDNN